MATTVEECRTALRMIQLSASILLALDISQSKKVSMGKLLAEWGVVPEELFRCFYDRWDFDLAHDPVLLEKAVRKSGGILFAKTFQAHALQECSLYTEIGGEKSCSLTGAIALHLYSVLNDPAPWAKCHNPECGRYFKRQLKNSKASIGDLNRKCDEAIRSKLSHYCCSSCQKADRRRRDKALAAACDEFKLNWNRYFERDTQGEWQIRGAAFSNYASELRRSFYAVFEESDEEGRSEEEARELMLEAFNMLKKGPGNARLGYEASNPHVG